MFDEPPGTMSPWGSWLMLQAHAKIYNRHSMGGALEGEGTHPRRESRSAQSGFGHRLGTDKEECF